MDKDEVRNAIQALIKRKDDRISELQRENKHELQASKRLYNEVAILELSHSVNTLFELEHNLRLCGCPDEAYTIKQEG